ncbi:MAG: hypothetical protein ABW298_10235 [Candidatus Binatia bacterium]|jgi:hypothetical protein
MQKSLVILMLVSLLTLAVPRAEAAGDFASDAGVGIACVFVNILYVPAKIVYATLGGFTGGVAYLLTGANYEVADRIWTPSLGGNYLVTPAHLRNEETLYFSGTVEQPQTAGAPQDVPPPPPPP